jgi:hypothetical protein
MGDRRKTVEAFMPGLPPQVLDALNNLPEESCGRCLSYMPDTQRCCDRNCLVRPADPGCGMFLPA